MDAALPGVLDPLDLAQPRLRRMDGFGKRAEFLQEQLGERLGVAARDRRIQGHLQQLVIAQRIGARAVEPFAQPLAMAVIMRLLGGCIQVAWTSRALVTTMGFARAGRSQAGAPGAARD